MKSPAIALSGRICAGKTTLARALANAPGGLYVSTRDILKSHIAAIESTTEREALQRLGRQLDVETDGRWLTDSVRRIAEESGDLLLIDAVRISAQIEHLAEFFDVIHIHLTAELDVLEHRYDVVRQRRQPDREMDSYASVSADPTEAQVESLADRADLVIDTGRCDPEQTRREAVAAISARTT